MNSSEAAQQVTVQARGIDGLTVFPHSELISIPASSSRVVPIRLRAPEKSAAAGSHRIEFVVQTAAADLQPLQKAITVHEKSVFLFPR
jgi:hypothetical protein